MPCLAQNWIEIDGGNDNGGFIYVFLKFLGNFYPSVKRRVANVIFTIHFISSKKAKF